ISLPVKRSKKKYSALQIASSMIMVLALLWLTVCTPFVNKAYEIKKEISQKHFQDQCEDNSNLFSNITEEKNPNSNTLSEYLHDTHHAEKFPVALNKFYKGHPTDLYFEYDPELISPPPEV
ncbi:MAG TPA: hypothetical protein VEV15_07300, partial [Flavisolibacter sp.]|nr:hypothetical protein [Flavisolibacter sp.]